MQHSGNIFCVDGFWASARAVAIIGQRKERYERETMV